MQWLDTAEEMLLVHFDEKRSSDVRSEADGGLEQALEWWYTSAEGKLANQEVLPPPPPPPPPPPHPQVWDVMCSGSVCVNTVLAYTLLATDSVHDC